MEEDTRRAAGRGPRWSAAPEPPEGLVYQPEFVTEAEEAALVAACAALPLAAPVMHGVAARRETAHFGVGYGLESRQLGPAPPVPAFLEPLRARVAAALERPPEALAEVLVTRYPPGAAIGWHRDAPPFGEVAGVSLLAPCRLRFRQEQGDERRTWEVMVEPRSLYLLRGPARTRWQHHIPPVRELRWSITFRTLRRARRERERRSSSAPP